MRSLTILTSAVAFLLAMAPGTAAQRQNPPDAQPLAKVEFPPYEERLLDNGLRVFALEHDEQPLLSVQLVIGGGGVNDPPDLPGLATFTTALLDTGTTTRSAQEIAESVDMAGGELSTRAARAAIIVSASVLKDSTDLAFELMTDIVMNPRLCPRRNRTPQTAIRIGTGRQSAGSGFHRRRGVHRRALRDTPVRPSRRRHDGFDRAHRKGGHRSLS